jgi:alkylated DNA repair dioxygenase AlkB
VVLAWQPSLLDGASATVEHDPQLTAAERHDLGDGAWLDVVPGWVTGVDALFESVLDRAPWAEHERRMYDRMVTEPRLTTRLWTDPPEPVAAMAETLSRHYDAELCTVSANLYRDGRDSVAWHSDRVGRQREQTVVAILSLGSPRRFLLRPVGGGSSRRLLPQSGDLVVLGGTVQRTWQHCVPKVARAGPRISVMFREAY